MQTGRHDRKRGRKTALFTGVVLLTLAALMFLWWQTISRPPNIVVPTPKLPTPNAHDDFVAAGNVLALSGAPASANAGWYKQFQKGLHETYWAPPARSNTVLFPYYAQFRAIARALSLKQQTEARHGDWNGAVNTGLDCIQMGEQIPHGAVLIGELVGIACEAIGRQSMWAEVDHLNAAQARSVAKRLEGMMAQQFPYDRTLQEEEWCEQSSLQEIFRKPNWQKQFTNLTGNPPQGGNNSAILDTVKEFAGNIQLALHGGPRAFLNNYTRYMDALRARARLRYGMHPSAPPVPNDPINQILMPVFDQAGFKDVFNQTEDQLLLVKLALRGYYVEHGRYPQTLDELSPAYLSAVPQDQFAPSGTLHYRRTGAKYVLYSVGPDGIDDGGKPIINPPNASFPNNSYLRYRVQPDSKGDIVAGINR